MKRSFDTVRSTLPRGACLAVSGLGALDRQVCASPQRAGVHLLYFSYSGPVYRRAPISSTSTISASPLSLRSAFFSSISFRKTASGVPMRPELYSKPSSGSTTIFHSSAEEAYLGLFGLRQASTATCAAPPLNGALMRSVTVWCRKRARARRVLAHRA